MARHGMAWHEGTIESRDTVTALLLLYLGDFYAGELQP